MKTHQVCCYPTEPGFVSALADLTADALVEARKVSEPRVLFSAHGLPKKIIDAGDPYQKQVEETVAAVVERLAEPDLDVQVCYQSRLGPLEWIGPSTEDEIRRAASDGKGLVVVPVAFVSEHSETLVELDLEYDHLAQSLGVPTYVRVPTVGQHPDFIAGLAGLVERAMLLEGAPATHINNRICDSVCRQCPHQNARAKGRKAA